MYIILILTFKTFHKTAPQYSFALVVPMIKLKHYGERSFGYAAPVKWNKIDVEMRPLPNLETFKKKS